MDDANLLKQAWDTVQFLIQEGLITGSLWWFGYLLVLLRMIVAAGHDRSDGGLITCLLEMSFAGNCGFAGSISPHMLPSLSYSALISYLFSEELGFVFEVPDANLQKTEDILRHRSVPFSIVGRTTADDWFSLSVDGGNLNVISVLHEKVSSLRDIWEQTSFELEKRQANLSCVLDEQRGLTSRTAPPYQITFPLDDIPKLGAVSIFTKRNNRFLLMAPQDGCLHHVTASQFCGRKEAMEIVKWPPHSTWQGFRCADQTYVSVVNDPSRLGGGCHDVRSHFRKILPRTVQRHSLRRRL